jgi:uncharacterized protein YdhG (YjbR/CyaY superfamily)
MKSTASTVAGYIDEQPDEWKPTLRKLRATCRRELPGFTEELRYGMPSYTRDGVVEVSFAAQARHLSLYVLQQPVFDAHRADLAGLSLGKGCIRYRRPDQVEWAVVASLLGATLASEGDIC